MWSQKLSWYEEQPVGSVTAWDSVSVCVLPYPSSQASQEPLCGGSLLLSLTTPEDVVHGDALPVSNPGLPSSCADAHPLGVALASLLCVPSPIALTALTL